MPSRRTRLPGKDTGSESWQAITTRFKDPCADHTADTRHYTRSYGNDAEHPSPQWRVTLCDEGNTDARPGVDEGIVADETTPAGSSGGRLEETSACPPTTRRFPHHLTPGHLPAAVEKLVPVPVTPAELTQNSHQAGAGAALGRKSASPLRRFTSADRAQRPSRGRPRGVAVSRKLL